MSDKKIKSNECIPIIFNVIHALYNYYDFRIQMLFEFQSYYSHIQSQVKRDIVDMLQDVFLVVLSITKTSVQFQSAVRPKKKCVFPFT